MWTGTEGPTAVAAETQEGVKKGHIPTRVRALTALRMRPLAPHEDSCAPLHPGTLTPAREALAAFSLVNTQNWTNPQ